MHADTGIQTVKQKDAPTVSRMANDVSDNSLIVNDAFQPRELNRESAKIYDTDGSIFDEHAYLKRFSIDKHQRLKSEAATGKPKI